MVTKLFEVKLGENGCSLRAIEGSSALSLTPGQVERAQKEEDEEDGIKLFTYQELDNEPMHAWCDFLKVLTNEFGPKRVKWVDCVDDIILMNHEKSE